MLIYKGHTLKTVSDWSESVTVFQQGSKINGKFHLICSISDQKTRNHLKVLEAKDIEDTDRLEVFLSFDFLVDFHYDPGKTLGIKCHGN